MSTDPKKKLEERVDDIHEELDLDRRIGNARKRMTREWRAFEKLPGTARTPFYCRPCRKDFVAPAWKEWSFFFNCGSWFSRCPDCGGECARYISQKTKDPYYELSNEIRKMRGDFATDMLRPDQYGFKTLYGEPFAEWQAEQQRREEELRGKYAGLGIKGQTVKEREERSRDFTMEEVFGKDD